MNVKTFRAMVVEEAGEKQFSRSIQQKTIDQLPDGEVLIKVMWSSLNYKDALSASGNRGVTRKYPHTPGIDAAGVVEESRNEAFSPGDKVIVTSYDLGMNTAGGFGQYIRVPAAWVVPLPTGLDLRESMIFGTAGFTAGMSVMALTHCVPADRGDILVTGATGGVGSLAVALLAGLGYSVSAVSGKAEAVPFLTGLGARKILSRAEATAGSERPLLKGIWAGVIDTVGGDILVSAIKSTDLRGVVTCCGNVASPELPLNVFPFILRGVSLLGIDSQNCPMERRKKVWQHLATDWKPTVLAKLCREVSLEELDGEIELILKGGQTGRIIVRMDS
ncbi:acryloyl-CoA reductase [Desulfopila sp. IMCC35006]|uniref:YhdH/YhfP family quinone oxidoreductase n=1 Tax=Desulfopila sp. IMCC35006 TaxID=2569542 RepID=UPI0010ADA488|nr:YhdH/YhfP family quinone oxidoreductase [Desulfopila sp. IMCC35006]TKB28128.1 acryloyl-CoA reductase [Desulfopila sp. IMCC35006]